MVDVVITSTCRDLIEKTIKSFLDHVSYSGKFNFIVNVDVLNNSYLERLLAYFKKMGITDVKINRDPGHFHNGHTKAINYLYGKVSAPFFFHLQDDWLFLKKINLDQLIDTMQKNPVINHIRFSKQTIQDKTWMFHLSNTKADEFMVPNKNVTINGVPLVQTYTWSFNPSLVRTAVVKKFTNIPVGTRAETYMCHEYPKLFGEGGCFIWGKIGDRAAVKDIGRGTVLQQKLRKALKKMGITVKK